MLRVEQYTLFKNSSDFDVLIKKSRQDIESSNEANYNDFIKNILPQIKTQRSALILYERNNPIGYQVFLIKNQSINFSFSYIMVEKRGNGFSYFLREKFINFIWDKTEKICTTINSSNKPSIKSLNKLMQKYSCDFTLEKIISPKGNKYEKYTITKRSD